jgi:hypothetical protein
MVKRLEVWRREGRGKIKGKLEKGKMNSAGTDFVCSFAYACLIGIHLG